MNSKQMTRPLDLKAVHIHDSFWSVYQKRVIEQMIPYQWEALNDRIPGATKSGCMQNFRIAAGLAKGEFHGFVFQDSDFSKWIEAVAYALTLKPDPKLEKIADEAIALVVSAQQDDGYLNTYYIINGIDKRFTNIQDNHELYCFGHMLEGAVAYYQATGKDKLLSAMIRFADCIDANFGLEEGKRKGYPGHEVAEMALMRLYAITKDEKHLKLAKYFVDQRGQSPQYFEEERKKYGNPYFWENSPFQYQYYQAGKPVRGQETADGHAVRAVYLYSGMADVARVTGDEELYQATKRLWENMVHRRMYITGGIGSSEYGESFTYDYDLPNDTIYAETCASIGLVFFARRMLEIAPMGEYADVMEKALYNGIISGSSLDGTSFFYVNPLEVVPQASREDHLRRHVKPTRQKWFGCACCPPNLARLVTSLGAYAYTANADTLYMHLYMGSKVDATLGGERFSLDVQSGFPWQGDVNISVLSKAQGKLALRIPGWCGQYAITLNGETIVPALKDGYAILNRLWMPGDTLQLHFTMSVTIIAANPHVREDIGKLAVTRGPIVYCLEETDNGTDLHLLRLCKDLPFTQQYRPELLGGVTTLEAYGEKLIIDWSDDQLYKPAVNERYEKVMLTFIPYYAWANRTEGEMLVWIRQK
jgi:DUF1680 family protein